MKSWRFGEKPSTSWKKIKIRLRRVQLSKSNFWQIIRILKLCDLNYLDYYQKFSQNLQPFRNLTKVSFHWLIHIPNLTFIMPIICARPNGLKGLMISLLMFLLCYYSLYTLKGDLRLLTPYPRHQERPQTAREGEQVVKLRISQDFPDTRLPLTGLSTWRPSERPNPQSTGEPALKWRKHRYLTQWACQIKKQAPPPICCPWVSRPPDELDDHHRLIVWIDVLHLFIWHCACPRSKSAKESVRIDWLWTAVKGWGSDDRRRKWPPAHRNSSRASRYFVSVSRYPPSQIGYL